MKIFKNAKGNWVIEQEGLSILADAGYRVGNERKIVRGGMLQEMGNKALDLGEKGVGWAAQKGFNALNQGAEYVGGKEMDAIGAQELKIADNVVQKLTPLFNEIKSDVKWVIQKLEGAGGAISNAAHGYQNAVGNAEANAGIAAGNAIAHPANALMGAANAVGQGAAGVAHGIGKAWDFAKPFFHHHAANVSLPVKIASVKGNTATVVCTSEEWMKIGESQGWI